ncbi:MAG: hypothetical protein AVDCRST_MAG16-325, partial [uncultured Frankineae bacterium]
HVAVHGAGPARAVLLHPRVAARGVRPRSRPAQPRVRRRPEAGPAGGAPVHPPGVARHGGRALPAGGGGRGPSGAGGVPAGLRL